VLLGALFHGRPFFFCAAGCTHLEVRVKVTALPSYPRCTNFSGTNLASTNLLRGFSGSGLPNYWIFRVGTFPNDLYLEILANDALTPKLGTSTFHLSCSDVDMNGPEERGKVAGDGKAVAGYKNWWLFAGMGGNGLTLDCGTVQPPQPPDIDVVPVSAPRPGDHWFFWDLKNNGPDTAILTKVEVTKWPSQQGKLKKIKLGADVAADPPDIPWPGPAIITVFTADVNKKKIAAGQTRTFAVEFEKNYSVSSNSNLNYSLTITFEGGETVKWNTP
jgi:hypothetical protein